MRPYLERSAFLLAIAVAAGLLVSEARAQAQLEDATPLSPKALYEVIGKSRRLQVIDLRPMVDDADFDVGGYEATHVPGAIPLPGCDPAQAPDGAAAQVLDSVPTVIVTRDGSDAEYAACAARFVRARKLDGGMLGWLDAMLPEDAGSYMRPSVGGGGGCL